MQHTRGNQTRRGIGLVMMAITLTVIFGILALCFDMARVYIAKNELQTYADAATLAATEELDGTSEGLNSARATAKSWPIKWRFGTETVPAPAVFFSAYPNGPWFDNPPDPEDMRFAQVIVTGPVRLFFAPVFGAFNGNDAGGDGTQAAATLSGSTPVAMLAASPSYREATVTGAAAAGQLRQLMFAQGLLPYTPHAHLDEGRTPVINPLTGEPDPFNFKVGARYTMRWPPPGHTQKHNRCDGDAVMPDDFPPNRLGGQRGFLDIGDSGQAGSNGSAFIRQAILNGDQGKSLRVGEPVILVSGQRETEIDALQERIRNDSDSTAKDYTEYVSRGDGNGRRLVYMPVNNPYDNDRIVDFAAFFLPPENEVCGNGNSRPCCAEYVGAGLLNSDHDPASAEPGIYNSRLIQ